MPDWSGRGTRARCCLGLGSLSCLRNSWCTTCGAVVLRRGEGGQASNPTCNCRLSLSTRRAATTACMTGLPPSALVLLATTLACRGGRASGCRRLRWCLAPTLLQQRVRPMQRLRCTNGRWGSDLAAVEVACGWPSRVLAPHCADTWRIDRAAHGVHALAQSLLHGQPALKLLACYSVGHAFVSQPQ